MSNTDSPHDSCTDVPSSAHGLSESEFAAYIDCYTSRRYDELASRWYTPEVTYEGFGVISGRDNVVAYFRDVLHVGHEEHYEIRRLALAEKHIGVELLIARTYCVSMEAPVGPVEPGDRFEIRLVGLYDLDGDRIAKVSLSRLALRRLGPAGSEAAGAR